MKASDQGNVQGMDDSRVDQPVARGPLKGATVNSELLDETRGLREGSAGLTRGYPYLGKLGEFTINAQNWLVDDKWQYQRMNMPDNWERRIPVIYTLAEAPASLMNSYIQAAEAIANAPFSAQLRPLDNDPDFIYYGALFAWGGPPDFQPRFHQLCSTDRTLTGKSVQKLIDRIQGGQEGGHHIRSVAKEMALRFKWLYERPGGVPGHSQGQSARAAPDDGIGPVADSALAGEHRGPTEGAAGDHGGGGDAGQWRVSTETTRATAGRPRRACPGGA